LRYHAPCLAPLKPVARKFAFAYIRTSGLSGSIANYRATRHTTPSAETIESTAGTSSRSTDTGSRGRRRLYRTCSRCIRNCKPIARPLAATSCILDSE